MTRIAHLLRELGRSLYRNFGTALSSFLSLALLLLLFDVYWAAAKTSDRFYAELLSGMRMEAFVDEAVPDSTIPLMKNDIDLIDGVLFSGYVSKESAREELSRLVGSDLLVGYDSLNPLPRSFVLSFSSDYLTSAKLAEVEKKLAAMPGIANVYYSSRWLNKAETTRAIVLNIGLVLGALILLSALISSTNNIRLMTRTRAVGFLQMRLSGAGRLFLALPFLLEGLLISGLSAVAGWLLLFYMRGKIAFTQFEVVFPMTDEIVIFCAAAAGLGVISGYLGIRKLLR
ncbi:MAG: permease-like cell division protein FtsX [candidate division Zixibacteria bacterium]|nr:permease-like cell division protein FtsX [candidate division Zixibacteria bacterium]